MVEALRTRRCERRRKFNGSSQGHHDDESDLLRSERLNQASGARDGPKRLRRTARDGWRPSGRRDYRSRHLLPCGCAGDGPEATKVRQCMTSPAVIATRETSLDECCSIMEKYQIRRLPIVDATGQCCGIVSLADIATRSRDHIDQLVSEISQPTQRASNVQSATMN